MTVYEAKVTAPDTGETVTLSAGSEEQLDRLIDETFGVDQADSDDASGGDNAG